MLGLKWDDKTISCSLIQSTKDQYRVTVGTDILILVKHEPGGIRSFNKTGYEKSKHQSDQGLPFLRGLNKPY